MKYTIIFVLSMALFFTNNTRAQRKVESGAYSAMLSALLSHSVTEVTVKSAHKSKNVLFLDAREKEEFNVSHIQNAVWVGYDDFDMSRIEKISKDKNIIVYCSVGKRSENIAKKLEQAGYKNVANMYGGLFEWVNQGYEINDSSGKTNKVHAYSRAWSIWLNKGEKVYE